MQARDALKTRLFQYAPLLQSFPKWIILNPNASEMLPLRRWALASYADLAQLLLQDDEVVLLITGAASEKPEAQALIRGVAHERMLDLTGFTSLEELPILYTLCIALITNDSGPAHFAAPTEITTFVFFGPETPTLYGALNPQAHFFYKGLACSPCVSAANHRKTACNDNQCLRQISVAEVYDHVSTVLNLHSEPRSTDRGRASGECRIGIQ